MATRILHLLRERRNAAYATLALFVLSFSFFVFTRVSNPLASYQNLDSMSNPKSQGGSLQIQKEDPQNPNPSPTQADNAQIRDERQDPNPNPSPIRVDNPRIQDEQRDPNPNPSPSPVQVDGPSSVQVDNSQVNEDSNDDEPAEELEMKWEKCGGAQSVDYIPCLDNWKAIKELKSRRHMEHRERHCPKPSPRCLVPLPKGYKTPVLWPKSRDMIWYDNVPHPKLVEYKKEQNWVRKSGDYFIFPGGGTQFKGGVAKYAQFIEQTLPTIEWGRRTRVILDVGCGVASFGGYLLDRDVLTMSLAPKDEHEAQIQFALERGIPAFLSVIGTQRLTFPDNVFDVIHCARCRVHWDADGGKPLMELNRILRPGGFFIWSATPVYRDDNARDKNVWNAMVKLTKSMCWKTVTKAIDANGIGLVIYEKPVSNSCYEERKENDPPLCAQDARPSLSWYTPLDNCLPYLPALSSVEEKDWPISWPERLSVGPSRLQLEQDKRDAEEKFYNDTKNWDTLVSDLYLHSLAINWSSIRNVMDMNAGFGG
ncbi:probable methyltransferase PMT23 isoform X2 [Asparagus officinalis]|nr:probable methyltransferase PMT23 isoform X2 [Asparagus officinalis]